MVVVRRATDPGFSIHKGVFDRSEMARTLDELALAPLDRTKAGARHVLRVSAVRRLAEDPCLLSIARQYVGPAACVFRATLFDKSPAANWLVVWHQDTALPLRERFDDGAWGPWSRKAGVLYAHAPAWALEQIVALRVSLDDSTTSNGPLRVLPCTHTRGVLTDPEIEEASRAVAAVDGIVAAGGVIAMRPLIIHASSKAESSEPRRVLHIEFAKAMELREGVQLAVG